MGSTRGSSQMAGQMQNTMRQRALQRQEMSAPPRGMPTPFQTSAPQPAFGTEATPQMAPARTPEPSRGRSGIIFGPGRSSRLPDQGSPEYEQLLQRVRGLAQMK